MKKRDWKKVKLGDLMLKRNKSVNPAKFKEEFFELYSIPAYSTEQAEIIQGSSIGSSKKTVEEDDVLLSRIVPHIQRCWIVPEKKELRQIASGEWIVFRSEKVLSNYLRFFLLSKPFHKRFMGTVRGVGGSLMRADPKQVADFQIPLPPLAEQKAIAAQLDRADKLRQALAQSLADYDRLLAASFLDMFGDPVLNPKGWEVVKFTDVVVLKRGFDLPLKSRIKGKYPIIASNGPLDYHNEYKVKGPGVVTGRSGTIGNVFYIEDDYWPLNTSLYAEDLRGNNPIYLYFLLQFFRLDRFKRGSGVPTLNRNLVHRENLFNVPLSLQQQFAQLVERIERQKALIQSAQQSAEDLFGALLQAYFYEGK
ncbi:restriction endonuclease subunit S [Saprospira grandis]|uniref:Type I restriction modification enzyme protein S n=1 Tax=Saprospira grandis (strain Lewin) TaxID=984262 RepID=H6L1R4_SAPGL|nr:restriction endonuclease subunit S [Saprospira grandis]AFC26142.1 type I restriction modification enzyme protein S [Saprospira grandis str. Lewin]